MSFGKEKKKKIPSHLRILFNNNNKKSQADIDIYDTTISARLQNPYKFSLITFLFVLIHKVFITFIHI